MKLNEYQNLASRTGNNYGDWKAGLINYALGVTGESGEVADMIKKTIFHGHELSISDFKKELGDILWYVSQLASVCNLTLEDVAQTNIKKLKRRYPDGFSEKASINRKE